MKRERQKEKITRRETQEGDTFPLNWRSFGFFLKFKKKGTKKELREGKEERERSKKRAACTAG